MENKKRVRVVVRMPSELIERIDARRFGELDDPVAAVNQTLVCIPTHTKVTLLLSPETIEMLDAFRAARGVKTRADAIIRLLESGLEANASRKLN
jgi:hypothetical protein